MKILYATVFLVRFSVHDTEQYDGPKFSIRRQEFQASKHFNLSVLIKAGGRGKKKQLFMFRSKRKATRRNARMKGHLLPVPVAHEEEQTFPPLNTNVPFEWINPVGVREDHILHQGRLVIPQSTKIRHQ